MEQYNTMEPNKKIPSFCFESPCLKRCDFEMSSVTVVGGQRRRRARWTSELAQDLDAYHGIDAETELTALLNQEITEEIDRNLFGNPHYIIVQDLVPVQPLDLPLGRLHYLDYIYMDALEAVDPDAVMIVR